MEQYGVLLFLLLVHVLAGAASAIVLRVSCPVQLVFAARNDSVSEIELDTDMDLSPALPLVPLLGGPYERKNNLTIRGVGPPGFYPTIDFRNIRGVIRQVARGWCEF